MAAHLHIMAKEGSIAETVLLPGDPLRAKFIAENFLEDVVCYNEVRGMYGYTGIYKGKRISVQGTGMGLPSHSIYVNELIIKDKEEIKPLTEEEKEEYCESISQCYRCVFDTYDDYDHCCKLKKNKNSIKY